MSPKRERRQQVLYQDEELRDYLFSDFRSGMYRGKPADDFDVGDPA
jgi:hypothetical protein